jgi:hypothetical protein
MPLLHERAPDTCEVPGGKYRQGHLSSFHQEGCFMLCHFDVSRDTLLVFLHNALLVSCFLAHDPTIAVVGECSTINILGSNLASSGLVLWNHERRVRVHSLFWVPCIHEHEYQASN